jgi:iron complex outermembrane receptor protein
VLRTHVAHWQRAGAAHGALSRWSFCLCYGPTVDNEATGRAIALRWRNTIPHAGNFGESIMQISSGGMCAGTGSPSRTTSLSAIHALACAAALAAAGWAAPASAQQQTSASSTNTAPLQEVVVTGSLIKRTDTETPSPVQIISAQDLQKSGYTTVSDVLRNVAANGAGTLNQGFGQAFASGGSGIALRGLTVGDTLTLIDGERMVAYPLSDDGERSFVDVSAIPVNAIEGIEIVKDGASALYGADAVAGVVNIKLKQTYVGAEVTGEGGATQHNDGWYWHGSGILGWGDLNNDGYNIYVDLDYHRNGLIWGSSRSGQWTTLDWSGFPGGQNTNPGAIGATGLAYPDSVTGYVLNPANPTLQAASFLPGCTYALQAADKCTFSFPGQIQPPTSQTNFLSKMTKALGGDWKLVVTASLFDSVAQQTAPPTEPAFGHLLQNTGAEQGSIPLIAWGRGFGPTPVIYPPLTLPANSPINPFGATAGFVYSFPDVGPWVINTDTQTYRLFTDLKGTAAGWDLDASVGIMYAKMNLSFGGGLVPSAAQAALNNGTYVPGSSSNNIANIAPEVSSSPTSTLDLLDFHGVHDLFQMPGGPLTLAAGVQYFHKAQNDQDPISIASGTQEGITNFTVGSQDDTAGFLELGGKPVRQLEADAAVRYDHYDTYGGQASPKFTLKYTPIEMLAIRGTWGKGFRAPSISESGDSGIAFGQGNVNDPVLCPNGKPNVVGTYNALCSYPVTGISPSNPALKAVTSTNATFGVIFEPAKVFNVSVDWYYIKLTDDIISAAATGNLAGTYASLVRGPSVTLPVCTATTAPTVQCPTAEVLTPVGYPQFNLYPYVNAGLTRTSGIDVDLRSAFDIGNLGSLTAGVNYTFISQYEVTYLGQTFDLAGTHGPSGVSGDTGNPKQRAVATLTWDKGPATATVTVNYTGAFHITDPSEGWNTCLVAIQTSGNAYGAVIPPSVTTLAPQWNQFCSVDHFTTVNLYGRYAINDHFSVHASITNAFNSQPPVDLETYGGGAAYRYTTLDQDGAVGRFFLLGATLTF